MPTKAEMMRSRCGNGVQPYSAPIEAAKAPPNILPAYRQDLEAGIIATEDLCSDPRQPRKEFNEQELRDLANSMKAEGQLQSLLVRQSPDKTKWIIVDGERRWRAAAIAKIPTLRAIFICRDMSERDVRKQQLVANMQRSDLKAIEQAKAFQEMIDDGWSQHELGTLLHISQAHISRQLLLLTLPAPIQEQVKLEALPVSVAYNVARIDNPDTQQEITNLAVAGHIEEARARAAAATPRQKPRAKPSREPRLRNGFPCRTFASAGLSITITGPELSDEQVLSALADVMEQVRRGMKGAA